VHCDENRSGRHGKGERIEIKASSANTAAKNWLDEANLRGS